YHLRPPQAQRAAKVEHGWALPAPLPERALAKRHYRTPEVAAAPERVPPVDARVPLLFNADLTVSVLFPSEPDPVYFSNGDADELFYVFQGGGTLRTQLGDLRFEQDDYVHVPRGMIHRFLPGAGPQHWLSLELLGGMHIPQQWRNETGQLRMDAPYCHRDFRPPSFVGPVDELMRQLLVKRGGAFHGFAYDHAPLDVIGWDGTGYPFAFPILNFQPRVGLVHLPPTWHGTFA